MNNAKLVASVLILYSIALFAHGWASKHLGDSEWFDRLVRWGFIACLVLITATWFLTLPPALTYKDVLEEWKAYALECKMKGGEPKW